MTASKVVARKVTLNTVSNSRSTPMPVSSTLSIDGATSLPSNSPTTFSFQPFVPTCRYNTRVHARVRSRYHSHIRPPNIVCTDTRSWFRVFASKGNRSTTLNDSDDNLPAPHLLRLPLFIDAKVRQTEEAGRIVGGRRTNDSATSSPEEKHLRTRARSLVRENEKCPSLWGYLSTARDTCPDRIGNKDSPAIRRQIWPLIKVNGWPCAIGMVDERPFDSTRFRPCFTLLDLTPFRLGDVNVSSNDSYQRFVVRRTFEYSFLFPFFQVFV